MNKEGKMAEGKRVRYANAADGYKTPDNFPKTTTELGQMKTNDLRHLRHQVQDGLDRGHIFLPEMSFGPLHSHLKRTAALSAAG